LLAGAGIVGLAVGFGAQTLVRDVIAGVFILLENQFAVGDIIEIAGKPATVEAVTVRSTTLRDYNGYVHFVPNGEMKIVTNRSRGWNRVFIDVVVAGDQDADRALESRSAARQWRSSTATRRGENGCSIRRKSGE
jgi:small conductance mechanosensitive channel